MTEMELPRTFVERVLRDLGTTEGEALCRALDGEACVSIRVNPAKAEGLRGEQPARVSEVLPMLTAAGRVPWCADGFLLAGRPSFTFDSDFHAGAYYVQEAASQFVGCLLQGVPTSGARILDLCAAPGGKTTLYASLVGRGGLVVANEIDRRRASVLADNVRKWGTGNVVVTTCEPHAVCDCEAWFDVVAVDAPCSGEGMFRKDPAARGEWSENNVRQCAARQDDILREAWRALRPGGTLIYDTNGITRHPSRTDINIYTIDATAESARLGQAKLFNTMILGGYLKVCPVVKLENVMIGLKKSLPERAWKMLPENEKAINHGAEIIRKVR